MNLQNQMQQFNVDVSKIESMKCGGCGNNIFVSLSQLKFVSGLFTPLGQDTGLETKMHVCMNPICGLMYPGVMNDNEAKKYAKKPDAERFSWGNFFTGGMALAKAMYEANKAKAKVKS